MKHWISAFRPRTLVLAVASIAMGAFLAAHDEVLRWPVVFLTILTATSLQVLSNLANDYGDTIHGADSVERAGPSRAVQTGAISKEAMKRAIYLAVVISAICGLTMLIVAFGLANWQWIAAFIGIGLLAIWAAIAYTASKNPYGYIGLGDIMVMIFFGYVAVLGTYFLQATQLNLQAFLPATAVGLLSVAVLNVNNTRDIHSDRLAGKRSIPVRIGERNARIYHWVLLLGALGAAGLYVLLRYESPWQWLFLLAAPIIIRTGVQLWHGKTAAEIDPLLKQTALSTLLFTLLFGIGQLLG